MATDCLRPLVDRVRREALGGDGGELTGGQLLQCYLDRQDGAAFAALLRRHGPMVLGVCRRVLRNGHDAEDAYQATFLVLVRKAVGIVPRDAIAADDVGVAHRAQQDAKLREIELVVAIGHHDQRMARGGEPAAQRRAVPAIDGVMDDPHTRIRGREAVGNHPRPVASPIVNDDHFIGIGQLCENRQRGRDGLFDVALLVVHREKQRKGMQGGTVGQRPLFIDGTRRGDYKKTP